jgi:hypothetical protein
MENAMAMKKQGDDLFKAKDYQGAIEIYKNIISVKLISKSNIQEF